MIDITILLTIVKKMYHIVKEKSPKKGNLIIPS